MQQSIILKPAFMTTHNWFIRKRRTQFFIPKIQCPWLAAVSNTRLMHGVSDYLRPILTKVFGTLTGLCALPAKQRGIIPEQ